jgi:hypothetical protein
MAGSYITHNPETKISIDPSLTGTNNKVAEAEMAGSIALNEVVQIAGEQSYRERVTEHDGFIDNAAIILEGLDLYDPNIDGSKVYAKGKSTLQICYFNKLAVPHEWTEFSGMRHKWYVQDKLLSIFTGTIANHLPHPDSQAEHITNRTLGNLSQQAISRYIHLKGGYNQDIQKNIEHALWKSLHAENYITHNRSSLMEMAKIVCGLSDTEAEVAFAGSRIRGNNLKNYLNNELPNLKRNQSSFKAGRLVLTAT